MASVVRADAEQLSFFYIDFHPYFLRLFSDLFKARPEGIRHNYFRGRNLERISVSPHALSGTGVGARGDYREPQGLAGLYPL